MAGGSDPLTKTNDSRLENGVQMVDFRLKNDDFCIKNRSCSSLCSRARRRFSTSWSGIGSVQYIIFNGIFIISNTKTIIFNGIFIIFNGIFIIFNGTFTIFNGIFIIV